MKIPVYIIYIIVSCFCFAGCSAASDEDIPKQVENIERFLENNNMDYSIQQGVYRHIGNSNRQGYFDAPMAESGDSVYFYFAGYEFDRSRVEPAFYSNKDFIIEGLRDLGLSAVYWSRESKKIELGKSGMTKGITNGMPGCREGDSVRLFMPANLAYGENYMGLLPLHTAVEFVLWIDKVKK